MNSQLLLQLQLVVFTVFVAKESAVNGAAEAYFASKKPTTKPTTNPMPRGRMPMSNVPY